MLDNVFLILKYSNQADKDKFESIWIGNIEYNTNTILLDIDKLS